MTGAAPAAKYQHRPENSLALGRCGDLDKDRGLAGANLLRNKEQLSTGRSNKRELRGLERRQIGKAALRGSDRETCRQSAKERPSLPPIVRRFHTKNAVVPGQLVEDIREGRYRMNIRIHGDLQGQCAFVAAAAGAAATFLMKGMTRAAAKHPNINTRNASA